MIVNLLGLLFRWFGWLYVVIIFGDLVLVGGWIFLLV